MVGGQSIVGFGEPGEGAEACSQGIGRGGATSAGVLPRPQDFGRLRGEGGSCGQIRVALSERRAGEVYVVP